MIVPRVRDVAVTGKGVIYPLKPIGQVGLSVVIVVRCGVVNYQGDKARCFIQPKGRKSFPAQ
jgi:hypothetical protein